MLLEAKELSKTYGVGETRVEALRDVNLHISGGEIVAIMGPSGSGKSTLLSLLGGVDTPSSGQVLLEGVDLSTLDDNQRTLIRRRRLGFIFQAFNLLPILTAVENVALPLELDGISVIRSSSPGAGGVESSRYGGAAEPSTGHDVGRRTATCGHCAGAGHPTGAAPGGRTDREPGQHERAAHHGVAPQPR